MGSPDPFTRIDRLLCGDGHVPAIIAARTAALQAAARADRPADPLSRRIVDRLLERPGARIGVFTGFVVPEAFPHGENDGPLGAVALGRALAVAGFEVAIYPDPPVVDHTRWLAAELAAGVTVSPIPDPIPDGWPRDLGAAIAIEKPGRNAAGYLHAWNGERIAAGSVPIDAAIERLTAAGKPTIAIGDRGNEVGFGTIRSALLSLVPEARRCRCGCGAGTAAATGVELLLPATVSNWGAYGVCAALAIALHDPSLAVRPEEEERMLNVAAVRGCRDGLLRTAAFGVDGVSGAISMRVVAELAAVVRAGVD